MRLKLNSFFEHRVNNILKGDTPLYIEINIYKLKYQEKKENGIHFNLSPIKYIILIKNSYTLYNFQKINLSFIDMVPASLVNILWWQDERAQIQ